MPLTITYDGPAAVPTIACDHCGEAIAFGNEGIYKWVWTPEQAQAPLSIVHIKCSPAHSRANPPPAGGRWCRSPLALLPVYLGNRLRLNWGRARALAASLGDRS